MKLQLVPILASSLLGGMAALSSPLGAEDTAGTTAPPAAPMAQPPVVAPAPTASGDTTMAAPVPAEANPATYTVVTGDTLWGVAHKFHTSIRKLKKLNHLKSSHLKPGQLLKIPAPKAASSTPPSTGSLSHRHKTKIAQSTPPRHFLRAEPVQDFDLPASTFAGCPVPLPSDSEPAAAEPAEPTAPAVAVESQPVTAVAPANEPTHAVAPVALPAPDISAVPTAPIAAPAGSAYSYTPAPKFAPAPVKPVDHGLFSFFSSPPPATDWSARFTQVARDLGNLGLVYDEDWCPPGEAHAWTMDCSNTARYLYKAATGIQLPRTASDQYYYLHLQNKAWDVPQTSSGFADCNYLRQNLKPGDLLFWENTYQPERQPPITHVMVYLGTNVRGDWLMAGSQSGRGGEHNRRHGGPDIYIFDPTKPCGGYTTWFGLVHHEGRFCAFGRPLEADPSKLAVADD